MLLVEGGGRGGRGGLVGGETVNDIICLLPGK